MPRLLVSPGRPIRPTLGAVLSRMCRVASQSKGWLTLFALGRPANQHAVNSKCCRCEGRQLPLTRGPANTAKLDAKILRVWSAGKLCKSARRKILPGRRRAVLYRHASPTCGECPWSLLSRCAGGRGTLVFSGGWRSRSARHAVDASVPRGPGATPDYFAVPTGLGLGAAKSRGFAVGTGCSRASDSLNSG